MVTISKTDQDIKGQPPMAINWKHSFSKSVRPNDGDKHACLCLITRPADTANEKTPTYRLTPLLLTDPKIYRNKVILNEAY